MVFATAFNGFRISLWINGKRFISTKMDKQIDILGRKINYVKVGDGPRAVLCMPGALGTLWSDFKPQIEGLDRSKLTIVAWDPPGYGGSRPPDKTFDLEFFKKDAEIADALMKGLGIDKYSPIGWSDGGITALILASFSPSVEKLIVSGANAYLTAHDIKLYENILDTRKWSAKMRQPLVETYGDEGLQNMWEAWCSVMRRFLKEKDGDLCKKELKNIKVPTLVIQGNKDAMVPIEHAVYLKENITNARVHYFPEGKHNLHMRYADEFNDLVTKFLTES